MPTTDDGPDLTPNQINALVVLMAEARSLTNTELKELAGFALTGKDNARLVAAGLVETDRTQRPFAHELTDRGWKVVRELHRAGPPARSGSATRSLVTLLANLHRSLDRLRVSHGEFFKQAGIEEPAVVADAPASTAEVEAAIRDAYRELAGTTGEWVRLADVRDRLAGHDRSTVDAALRALARRDGVRVIPVANSKSLTARDRAAAVRIGDEDNHALSIGVA
ncbi:hypothetical protein [Micromonospora siamensis]|uniref:Uncharacterized protein n=1 Tax=Micromonospora siamensis TaxID=299152 RepID=A0A1C5HY42_9ACTN|nr:hypothetical protein [Micromonospora siamensis]SCG50859.1 hypothetical protein GA0074704_2554 [Micromonospora siamensis]